MRNVDSCRLQSAVLPRTDVEVRVKTELMGMSLSSVWTSDLKDSFASLAASFQVQQWEAVWDLTRGLEQNSRWSWRFTIINYLVMILTEITLLVINNKELIISTIETAKAWFINILHCKLVNYIQLVFLLLINVKHLLRHILPIY